MTATLSRSPRPRPAPPDRRRWPVTLAVGLVLGVLATAGIVVFLTPVLGLKSVTVDGATGSAATQVVDAVAVPDGTPLIRVDLAAVTRRVEAVPAVNTASVDRAWPNGLIVHVKVRVPVARTSANGATWLMDATGLLYATTGPGVEVPAGLTVLELATPGPGDPATAAALTVAAALTPAIKATVRTIRAPSAYAVTLVLIDGRQVIWGGADKTPQKVVELPGVLSRPGTSYDISDPGFVVVR